MDHVMGSDEESETGTDFVSWQSSQSTCHALNQLLKSSQSDRGSARDASGSSKGWQRQDSFDQIPGFSRLATVDNDSSPTKSTSVSHRPSSYARPHRPRYSDSKLRATSAGPDTPNPEPPHLLLPFFDKTNPSQFMDLLKGVSAHLDQRVGVKPRHSLGGGTVTSGRVVKPPRKRPRVASASGTSAELESLASGVKRSRLECSDNRKSESDLSVDNWKGKGKAQPGDIADTPDPKLSITRRISGIPMSARVESQPASSSNLDEEASPSNMRTTSEGSGKRPPPQRTVSQIKMPPPPVPVTKTYGAGMSTGDSSRPRYPTSSSSRLPPEKNIPPSNPEPVPKLHPLLLQQQSQSQSKPSSTPPTHPTPVPCSPASASLANKLKNYTNSQKRSTPNSRVSTSIVQNPTHAIPKPNFQPKAQQPQPIAPSSTPGSSQSSRPPVLGMRRAHTLPSSGLASSFNKSGPLPSKQKGFRPPLISASQPQLASQPDPQIMAAAPVTVVAPTNRGPTPISTHRTHPQDSDMRPAHCVGTTSGSTFSNNSIHRSYSNTSSLSSSVTSSISSTNSSEPLSKSASSTTTSQQTPVNLPRSSPLPEPSDGDGDSSFGDISFDMDALEETMKLYD